jgi:hypothetical protein
MDDVATVVVLTTAVVAVLQIVILALLLNVVARLKALAVEKDIASESKAAPREFQRHQPRPVERAQQFRSQPRPGPAPQAQESNSTDKSLRDINLRLKNAERDQENARRRMKESFGGRRDRDRNNRRDDFRRPRHGGGQNPQRFQDRPFDSNRPRPSTSFQGGPRPAPQQQARPEQARPTEAAGEPPAALQQPLPIPEQAQSRTEEPIQHGRFNGVKRRVLKSEEETGEERTAVSEPSPQQAPSNGNEQPVESPQAQQSSEPSQPDSGTEISFGRR